MDFMNGIFLGPLVEMIYNEGFDLNQALGDTPVLIVRLKQIQASAHKLKDTDPVSIFIDTKTCEYANPRALVCPILKTGRNRFPSEVMLGRALISDICLASPLISKLHVRFKKEKNGWTVADNFATNGTWLNGQKLSPHDKNYLRPNDELQFGDARALFLDPSNLAALCSIMAPEQAEA